jgi:hypothetical protein
MAAVVVRSFSGGGKDPQAAAGGIVRSGSRDQRKVIMQYLVYFFLAWNAFWAFFEGEYHTALTGPLSLVDETITIVLMIHLATHMIEQRRRLVPKLPFEREFILFLLVAFASWAVNMGSVMNAVQFIFSIIKQIIIFTWIVTFVRDDSLERWVLRFLGFMIALQVPFFILGFLMHGREYTGDNAKGAVNDSTIVAFLTWLGVIAQLGYYVATRKKRWIAGILLCITLLAITSTKQVTIFLPIAVIYLLRKQLGLSFKRILAFAAVGGVVLYFLTNSVEHTWADVESKGTYSYDDYDISDAISASEKIKGYNSALFEVPLELPFPLLGAGPGMYASYTAMTKRTPLAEKYIMYYDDLFEGKNTGTLTYRSSGLIAIFGDLGPIALVLWLMIYYKMFKLSMSLKGDEKNPQHLAASFVCAASCMLIVWESLVLNIFEGNVFILNFFWILCGGIVAAERGQNTGIRGELIPA